MPKLFASEAYGVSGTQGLVSTKGSPETEVKRGDVATYSIKRHNILSRTNRSIKRAEDLVFGVLLLIAFLPVFLFIAVAIKLESRGPVLFWQQRKGLGGELIWVCKFRSMYANAADKECARQTARGDARVTEIGKIIRRHSLDELPQLFNVVAGTMSLVGPRPHATLTSIDGKLVDRLVPSYEVRNQVKPGVTGWAQVNGRRGILDTMEKLAERIEHDLYYVENWTLMLDIKILAKTSIRVLNDKSAF